FFEETIYVTPSRLPAADQAAIAAATAEAAGALGLREGPVHAELRLDGPRAWLIEIAARAIGGAGSRTPRVGAGLSLRELRLRRGMSLEELILRHALGLPLDTARERRPAGVMMLPIPRAGVLEAVRGQEAAAAVPGVEAVTITAHAGQALVPLPEGAQYPGFIFARADPPDAVEAALREAHRRLELVIR